MFYIKIYPTPPSLHVYLHLLLLICTYLSLFYIFLLFTQFFLSKQSDMTLSVKLNSFTENQRNEAFSNVSIHKTKWRPFLFFVFIQSLFHFCFDFVTCQPKSPNKLFFFLFLFHFTERLFGSLVTY